MTWSRHGKGWRLAAVLVLGVLVVTSLPGCAGKDEEGPRSIAQLVSVNNNMPLQSDFYNNGNDKKPGTVDDFIPEDVVRLEITSRPHDDALTLEPGKPFGSITFHHYTLDYQDNDLNHNGTEDLTDFVNYPMNLVVPSKGTGIGFVLAVPGGWKTQGDLWDAYINLETYFTVANLTLYGVEETSHQPVTLQASFVIGFSDYADQ